MDFRDIAAAHPWIRLLAASESEQQLRGYRDTIREILQQPATWIETARILEGHRDVVRSILDGAAGVVLTGSGSSQYAGECVHPALQCELGVPVYTAASGAILTSPRQVLPVEKPAVMVSLARSGNSPESLAAMQLTMRLRPDIRHIVITCNPEGSIATAFPAETAHVIRLPERTNDRSLVMTSSFTNLALAARALGSMPDVNRLSAMAESLLLKSAAPLAGVAGRRHARVVYLGTGARYAAAREAGLKMLEMTAGRAATMAESYLGLRHGPMSFLDENTLIVCFVSSDPVRRAYELDLIRELRRKRLGASRILAGENLPPDLLDDGDTGIEYPGLSQLGDESAPVLDVLAGQMLATFRCLAEGLHPDSPSSEGVIHRVVEQFQIHSEEMFQ